MYPPHLQNSFGFLTREPGPKQRWECSEDNSNSSKFITVNHSMATMQNTTIAEVKEKLHISFGWEVSFSIFKF